MRALNPDQIEEEVTKYCMVLENMVSEKIITESERKKLRTKVKAWAYDREKEWAETAPNRTIPQKG